MPRSAGTARRNAEGGQQVAAQPPAPRPSRVKLATVADVERELSRLYRAARSRTIPAADASKLAHILWLFTRVREVGELERRLADVERRLHGNATA